MADLVRQERRSESEAVDLELRVDELERLAAVRGQRVAALEQRVEALEGRS